MAIMLGKLYAALRTANVDETQAREAAEEVAMHELKLSTVEGKLSLLQWMIGFNFVITAALALSQAGLWGEYGKMSAGITQLSTQLEQLNRQR